MSWKDKLIDCSFRGVPFRLEQSEYIGERRLALHEFLTSNRFGVEDLGRRPRQIQIQGYLVGDDYHAQRNRLIAALDAPGPAELAVSTYGIQQARVFGPYSVVEKRREGGYCEFRATFLEHRIELERLALAPTRGDVLLSWEDVLKITRRPPTDLLSLAKEARKQVRTVLGSVFAVVNKVRELNDYAQELLAVAEGIAGDVFDAYAAVNDLFGLMENTIQEVGAKIAFYRDLFIMETEENYSGDGYVASARRRATKAILQDLRASSAGGIAYNVVQERFESQDQAETRLAEVNAIVDELVSDRDTRPEIVVALRALRGDTEAYLRQVATDLPRYATIEARETTSLRLSYRMVGDLSRSRSIIARNRIRNPLSISGTVEVRAIG